MPRFGGERVPELALQQVVTGPQLGLSFGLSDLLVIEIGGRTVLYGLSRTEGRLVELTVAPDGSLTVAGSLALTGAFAAGSEPLLGFVDGAAGPKLLLAGMPPASGAFVSLDGDGSLVAQSADTDVGQMVAPLSLDLALGTAILSGRAGGGLDLYLDTILGPVWASGLADTSSTYLADISASAS